MAQVYSLTEVAGPEEGTIQVDLKDLLPDNCLNNNTVDNVSLDDGDLFQCGKCLVSFSSLAQFISHKKSHCIGGNGNTKDKTVIVEHIIGNEKNSIEDSFMQNDNEILSFPLDSNPSLCDIKLIEDFENDEQNNYLESFKVTTVEDLQLMTVSNGLQGDSACGPLQPTEVLENSQDICLTENNNESEKVCESLGSSLDQNLKCIYCSKVFNRVYNLKVHLRSHTGERPYQCIICGRTFSQNSNAKRHIATHKVWPKAWRTLPKTPNELNGTSLNPFKESLEKEILSFNCLYCPIKFKSYNELKIHREVHSSHKVFKCIQKRCKETFDDLDSLVLHSESHRCTYQCHFCQKDFLNLEHLSRHQSHHKPKEKNNFSISCIKCLRKFKGQRSFEAHMMEDPHSYECCICLRVFPCERFLRRHLESHSTSSQLCPTCGKGFNTTKSLRHHFLHTHSNNKRYFCNVCPANFKRRDNFIRHSLNHNNSNKFKCPYTKAGCYRAFARKDLYKNHLETHKSKSLLCKRCETPLVVEEVSSGSGCDVEARCTGCPLPLKHEVDDGRCSDDSAQECDDEVPTIEIVVMPVSGDRQHGDDDDATFKVMLPSDSPGSPQPTYTIQPFKPKIVK